ncbi:hypothetical protein P171DRAFT_430600 [Karstenula rhodostoma CBS 690.94]|uniref:Uncharacterized protein n=1 Tax=Karstenula rhodostoma CBS 690.94 TaxID=1392251 RepID=A0A9P4PLY3_9PLEO|nr:hypothetical protein P171DRAFT_430600 [Karstenula rhodostoma CBS 690.94]
MSFNSNHSNPKKRSAQAEDEAPRAKFPRSAFTSFEGASLPSSPPLLPLSSSLPEMHTHVEHPDAGLRLPFSLANLAPENSKKKRSKSFQDVRDIEITVKKPTNKPLGFSLTPSTSPRELDEAVVPVQTEFKGPINVLDARTGKTTTTRDPRGGFGYDPEANFTPESSFNSFSSVKTVVRHPISSTGLGPINLVDANTGKILTTRDPRGGFGYDPAVNFTPDNSFDFVQTVIPPSRFTLDSHNRPLYGISLFGPARPQEEDDDDDEKTVVGSPEDVANKDEFPSSSQSSFPVSNIIEPNSSFDDVLVCRQQGDFSFTSPSTKHCSAAANMNDIIEAEYYAEKLLRERPGSENICETMCSRLERMVNAKIAGAKREAKAKKQKVVIPKPVDAAVQLQKYLLDQKEMRLQMGEVKEIVELELRWTNWLVDVTKSGVMHLKVPGCACRPEMMVWDDEEARKKKDWW